MGDVTRRTALAGMGSLALAAPTILRAASATVPARTLSNPAASPAAQAMYRYLWSIYGKTTLTGQQEAPGPNPAGSLRELAYIEQVTGKLPAVLGLDYIHPADNAAVNARAIAWYRAGGIPTLCWHWGAPDIGIGYENSKKDFDVAAAFRAGTPQNMAMGRDLATIADHLTDLRDAGVPVLWRPFHEFTGDWFWWGKHGASGFKALWTLMHEYFTRERGLNNLIWVLGWAGGNIDAHYYPGRSYIDIAGSDTYVDNHGNLAPMFHDVRKIVGDSVPICLHECGPIPDPASLGPKADWLYFMTWHSEFIMDGKQNSKADLAAYYAAPRYVTRDELPKLSAV